jgi:FixJ family two-component response regulator
MKGGAVDFLTKPVDEAVLLTAIRRAVARTQADRQQLARVRDVQSRIRSLTPW